MEDTIKKILKKENIEYKKIEKENVGFSNLVYFVDDAYVIKLTKENKNKKKLEKEISIYKNIKFSFIPKFIASGIFNDYQYLIISKLKGQRLYSIWHKLSKESRQNCIYQIAKILKMFNKQDYNFLADEFKEFKWSEFLTNQIKEKSLILETMGFDTKNINACISKDLPMLFDKNIFGLIYNDAHFDNFIYDNGKLQLIDFDRVVVYPIDYEMLIFKTMCDNPKKFASEKDEDKIKNEDYLDVYNQFKENYPEMFNAENVEKRIKVYQFNYLIGQAIESKDRELIKNLLNNFVK